MLGLGWLPSLPGVRALQWLNCAEERDMWMARQLFDGVMWLLWLQVTQSVPFWSRVFKYSSNTETAGKPGFVRFCKEIVWWCLKQLCFSILWQVNNSNGNHADSFSIEIFDARQLGDCFHVSRCLFLWCRQEGTIGTGETTHRIPWKVVELQSEEPLKQLFNFGKGNAVVSESFWHEDIMFFVDMVGDELYCYQQAIPITAGQGHESDAANSVECPQACCYEHLAASAHYFNLFGAEEKTIYIYTHILVYI